MRYRYTKYGYYIPKSEFTVKTYCPYCPGVDGSVTTVQNYAIAMGTEQLTKQLMERLVEKCRYREPDAEYYYVPTSGWYTMRYEPVPCPRIMDAEQNSYTRCHVFMDEAMWCLYRDAELGQYVVSRMELRADGGIVYRFWALSSNELVTVILDFVRRVE